MKSGDYVLATKYDDGDPGDQYAVGFYDSTYETAAGTRHIVKDGDGQPFRATGFRRCEPITRDEGAWLVSKFPEFQPMWVDDEDRMAGKSVWDWLAEYRATHSRSESP